MFVAKENSHSGRDGENERSQAPRAARPSGRVTPRLAWAAAAWAAGAGAGAAGEPAFGQARLQPIETQYYTIYTDLDRDTVREAAVRITKMAEEYYERTKSFSGRITDRLPFHLYRNAADYYADGALERTRGHFDGKKLMAIAGTQITAETWETIQHEGFHQFVDAVIGGDIPVWANEGLAEYFGESLFTGDGFVSGVVPPQRLKQIKARIKGGGMKTPGQLMLINQATWNEEMNPANYDLAWSMVQFLAHGEGGKYQGALAGYIRDISRSRTPDQAWAANFGAGVSEFERAWVKYWTDLPDNPTERLYTQATVATLTSFLARAVSQGQKFESADAFLAEAKAGKLKHHPEDWLPASLLTEALAKAPRLGKWSLEGGTPDQPQLVLTAADDSRFTGSYKLDRGGRATSVRVEDSSEADAPSEERAQPPTRTRGTPRTIPTRKP